MIVLTVNPEAELQTCLQLVDADGSIEYYLYTIANCLPHEICLYKNASKTYHFTFIA